MKMKTTCAGAPFFVGCLSGLQRLGVMVSIDRLTEIPWPLVLRSLSQFGALMWDALNRHPSRASSYPGRTSPQQRRVRATLTGTVLGRRFVQVTYKRLDVRMRCLDRSIALPGGCDIPALFAICRSRLRAEIADIPIATDTGSYAHRYFCLGD